MYDKYNLFFFFYDEIVAERERERERERETERERESGTVNILSQRDTESSVDRFFFVLLSRGWYRANSKGLIIFASFSLFFRETYRSVQNI